jgi:hypothetical protein
VHVYGYYRIFTDNSLRLDKGEPGELTVKHTGKQTDSKCGDWHQTDSTCALSTCEVRFFLILLLCCSDTIRFLVLYMRYYFEHGKKELPKSIYQNSFLRREQSFNHSRNSCLSWDPKVCCLGFEGLTATVQMNSIFWNINP